MLIRTGTMVRDTTSDASSEIATVIANGSKNWPTIPPMKAIGRHTATVVSEVDSTGDATWVAPTRAASRGGNPRCSWLNEFSRTTMASSTTRPMAIVSPARVMMFSE